MAQHMTNTAEIISSYSNPPPPLTWATGEVITEAAIRKMIDLQLIGENADILDIGCGYGPFILRAAMQNTRGRVIGIDLTPDLVQKANEYINNANMAGRIPGNNPSRVFAIRGDARDLNNPSSNNPLVSQVKTIMGGTARFDLIVSIATLKQFNKQEFADCIRQWSRFLKPNGRMFIEIPSPSINAYSLLVTTVFGEPRQPGTSAFRTPMPYPLEVIYDKSIIWRPWPHFCILTPPGAGDVVKSTVRNWLRQHQDLPQILHSWDHEQLIENTGRDVLIIPDGFRLLSETMAHFNRPARGTAPIAKWVSWMDPTASNTLHSHVDTNKTHVQNTLRSTLWSNRHTSPAVKGLASGSQINPNPWWNLASVFVVLG
jgi:SAM-dependent methyltransferase